MTPAGEQTRQSAAAIPQSNYDRTLARMPGEFLKYDQRRMIEHFHLEHDALYLYLTLFARRYRVSRQAGTVEWHDGVQYHPGGFYDSMTIYDLLCCAKDHCRLAGRFCRAEHLPGAAYGVDPAKGTFDSFAVLCDRDPAQLDAACARLGGSRMQLGEVSWRLSVFDWLPVIVQFWSSDEEFPPVFKLMWDENTLDFLRFETVCYAAALLVERLRAYMA